MKITISKKELNEMGFETARDFLEALGSWLNYSDWTYISLEEWSVHKIIKRYQKLQLEAKEDCKP